ncbi:hypothetical protein HKCCE3408_00020 [Rhodobacterales bacterium HKCCE3408]|nr:hypothetical protein [Rhodobacterales bacterium HKCCE3408]
MTRTILGLTTAIGLAFAAPVMAQTADDDILDEVRLVLENNGYMASQAADLPTSDVAEIYLAATTRSAQDVRSVLSSMELQEMEVDYDMTPDTEAEVSAILVDEGYDADAVDYLSQAKIAEIYLAASGGDNDLDRVLAPLNLPMDGEIEAGSTIDLQTDVAEEVRVYLETEGYAPDVFESLNQEQIAQIYLMKVSGDEEPTRSDIDAIVNS